MLNKDLDIPYYVQIYNILKERIENGIYQPNETLPPESKMVKEFDVTRLTVRNALHKLKEENLINTIKGIGSVVIKKNKIEQSLFRFYSFGRDFQDKRFDANTIVVKFEKSCCHDINHILNLNEEEQVYIIERIRLLDKVPVILEYSYIPIKVASELEKYNFEKNSIYDILENNYQLHITNAREYLEPFILDEELSNLLKVPNNTPVFRIERTTYTNNETPIEYRISFIRSDKFRFYTDLKL